jgi:two-component system, LytTR family, response regulator
VRPRGLSGFRPDLESAMHKLPKRILPDPSSAGPQKVSPGPRIRKEGPEWIASSKRIFIQEGEHCWIVRVTDLVLLESEGNCTRLYFGRSRPMMARSLNYMEEHLDPAMFFRANRRTIINLTYVESIEPWINGGFFVRLTSGQEIVVSRRRGRMLKQKMTL